MVALAVVTLFGSTLGAAPPAGIALIAEAWFPAPLSINPVLQQYLPGGNPANCVPKELLSGFGSALTYIGHNHVYIAAPDRGPFDGLTDVSYLDRVHFLKITTDPGAPFPNITAALLDTRLLRNERGQALVGAAGSFDLNNEHRALRFDPEGIRVGLY